MIMMTITIMNNEQNRVCRNYTEHKTVKRFPWQDDIRSIRDSIINTANQTP